MPNTTKEFIEQILAEQNDLSINYVTDALLRFHNLETPKNKASLAMFEVQNKVDIANKLAQIRLDSSHKLMLENINIDDEINKRLSDVVLISIGIWNDGISGLKSFLPEA